MTLTNDLEGAFSCLKSFQVPRETQHVLTAYESESGCGIGPYNYISREA